MKIKTIILGLIAIFFTGDSILRVTRSNFNLGALLMYIITALLWAYTLFNKQIDAFTKHGFGLVLKIIFIIGCATVICTALFLCTKGNTCNAQNDEKAIIVLGAGLRGDKVYGVLARRLDAALAYHRLNPNALIVVSGGRGAQESVTEALAMGKYLVQHGVDKSLIIEEDKSTSTEENFAFSRAALQKRGISAEDAICYVTNTFHIYRAGKYAQRAGFTHAIGVPATTGAVSILSCYLREVCAVFYMWVFK